MGWVGYEKPMEKRSSYRVLEENPALMTLSVDRMIIYNFILNKYAGRAWIELMLLRIGQAADSFKHGKESSKKFAEFLNQMRNYQLLKYSFMELL